MITEHNLNFLMCSTLLFKILMAKIRHKTFLWTPRPFDCGQHHRALERGEEEERAEAAAARQEGGKVVIHFHGHQTGMHSYIPWLVG